MKNSIDLFYINIDNGIVNEESVIGMVDSILVSHGKEKWELSITFCDNAYIQKLNNEHRSKNQPTDVLTFSLKDDDSFPASPDEDIFEPAGDIVISLDTVKERCKEWEKTYNDELKRVIVHGVLHLLGYNHPDDDFDFQSSMLKKQERILENWENTEVLN